MNLTNMCPIQYNLINHQRYVMNANVDIFIQRILSIKTCHFNQYCIGIKYINHKCSTFLATLSNELQYSSASLLAAI